MPMLRSSANYRMRRSMRCCTEIPKWMFDAGHCAAMRLVDDPLVDRASLLTLKSAIAEQRVSLNAVVLQPQVSRLAGDGDADDTSPCQSNYPTSTVRRAPAVPSWNDLNESMRNDAVKLLAQLLVSVRRTTVIRSLRKRGRRRMSEKIKPQHTSRKAILYVRQFFPAVPSAEQP